MAAQGGPQATGAMEEDPHTVTHLLNELEGPDTSRVALVIR